MQVGWECELSGPGRLKFCCIIAAAAGCVLRITTARARCPAGDGGAGLPHARQTPALPDTNKSGILFSEQADTISCV